MWTYNKMHLGFKVRVKWGIGGLKKNGYAISKSSIPQNKNIHICSKPWFFSLTSYTWNISGNSLWSTKILSQGHPFQIITLEEIFKFMIPYMNDFVIILNIIWLKGP
jgi:hypothetical protein